MDGWMDGWMDDDDVGMQDKSQWHNAIPTTGKQYLKQ